MGRPSLTSEVQNTIADLFRQGQSGYKIAKDLGVNIRTVLKYRPNDVAPIDITQTGNKQRIVELFQQGKTINEVVTMLGISRTTVMRYKPAGIKFARKVRDRGTYKRKNDYPRAIFPVHPEIEEAKLACLAAFCAKPFSDSNFAKARARLAHLLEKYQPRDSRPLEQLDPALAQSKILLANKNKDLSMLAEQN